MVEDLALDASHSEAIGILDTIQDVSRRIKGLRAPASTSSSQSYVETLRSITTFLTDVSCTARILLNFASPVNGLPPEILSYIFALDAKQSVDSPVAHQPYYIPSIRRAVCLARVCTVWRNVALATPSLWSTVFCVDGSTGSYTSYIHLSRRVPLHVVVRANPYMAAILFKNHPSRTQHLVISDDSNNWTRRYDPRDLLTVVGPELITCSLDFHYWPRGVSEVSYSLFSGRADNLRTLVINRAKVIPSDDFPRLARLILYDISGSAQLYHILPLLSRCPTLAEVLIHSNMHSQEITHEHPSTPAALSSLRQIIVSMKNPLWLVSRLVVPSTCIICIEDLELPDLAILNTLPMCHELAKQQFTRLRITCLRSFHGDTNFHIELTDSMGQTGPCFDINLPVGSPNYHRTFINTLAAAFANTPLYSNVTVLWASSRSTQFTILPSILRALPTLTLLGIDLVAYDDRPERIAAVLCTQAGERDAIICPRLSTLCIAFSKEVGETIPSVERILASRANAGYPIRRLCVLCDEEFHDAALELRGYVDVLAVSTLEDWQMNGLPKEWRDERGAVDNGIWPEWYQFYPGKRLPPDIPLYASF